MNTYKLTVDPDVTAIDVRISATKSSERLLLDECARHVVLIASKWLILVSKVTLK